MCYPLFSVPSEDDNFEATINGSEEATGQAMEGVGKLIIFGSISFLQSVICSKAKSSSIWWLAEAISELRSGV